MRKIKILATILSVFFLLTSCSEYSKILNKGTKEDQYKMAVKMYEAKKYSKALRLLAIVKDTYRGKPQMERIQFMIAQSSFNTKDYTLSGYYFDRFTNNFPKSSKKEEAAFLSAYSYKLASPRFSLDQTDTNKALLSFQSFINDYPNSTRIEEANKHYEELRFKLEKKAFEIAMTYYKTAGQNFKNYKAAIASFDNLMNDYLGTKLKEEALYYRFKAYHDLVLVTIPEKRGERILEAIEAYNKLTRNFPKTKFLADSDKMLATIQKEQKQLVKS